MAAIAAGLLALTFALPASAIQVKIDSIGTASGSKFVPNKRLSRTSALVSDTSVKRLINISDCQAIEKQFADEKQAKVKVTWSWTDFLNLGANIANANYGVKVAPPNKTCDTNSHIASKDDGDGCKAFEYKSGGGTAGKMFEMDLNDLVSGTKCTGGTDAQAKVHFIIKYQDTNLQDRTEFATLTIDLDLSVPNPPTVSSVSGGNQNIKVTWKHADTNTTKARVYWSEISFSKDAVDAAPKKSDTLTATSYKITDLTNDKTYFIAVTAMDDAENESPAKEVVEARPVPVQDLWQYYKANGGASEGGFYPGCQASRRGDGGWLAALLVVLLIVGVRLRERWSERAVKRALGLLAVAAIGVSVFAATEAHAESPRTASVDVRFGYYLPAIDTEFADNGSGHTPYKDVMKDSALHKGITVDWLVFNGFGELSFGFGLGFWEQEGTGKAYDGSKTDDKTILNILPITLDMSYRFTVLAEKFRFPLVPYGRVGAGYGIWWITNGLEETATYTDSKGNTSTARGGVAGLHWSAGIRLLLDVFEPQAAKGFDMELGVNHSYLFIEYQRMSLNNFGTDKKVLDLSDDIVHFGLAFDL